MHKFNSVHREFIHIDRNVYFLTIKVQNSADEPQLGLKLHRNIQTCLQ